MAVGADMIDRVLARLLQVHIDVSLITGTSEVQFYVLRHRVSKTRGERLWKLRTELDTSR